MVESKTQTCPLPDGCGHPLKEGIPTECQYWVGDGPWWTNQLCKHNCAHALLSRLEELSKSSDGCMCESNGERTD